jgi:formylglycine-generating enzyme required for sulfatase activity
MKATLPDCQVHWPVLGIGMALLVVVSGCDRQSDETQRASSPSPAPAAASSTQQLVPLTNMVLIKPGSFLRQNQTVTLTREFWLGRYEVTQAEYDSLIGTNRSYFKEDAAQRPVEKVSHVEATGYCVQLTARERGAGRLPPSYAYRLPTEAEWEYACRAGTTNFFSFDDPSKADQYAWTMENSEGKTHPVGQKLPNPWGLFDMHGNVWEWCSDWFAKYPPGDLRDPLGPPTGKHKVFRGGGWNNEIQFARCANRFVMAPTNGIHFVGFRVALSEAR